MKVGNLLKKKISNNNSYKTTIHDFFMKFLTALFTSAAILLSSPVFPSESYKINMWDKKLYLQAFDMYMTHTTKYCSDSGKKIAPDMDKLWEKSQFNNMDRSMFNRLIDFAPKDYIFSRNEIKAFMDEGCEFLQENK